MNLLVQSITGSNLKSNDMTHTSKEFLIFFFSKTSCPYERLQFSEEGSSSSLSFKYLTHLVLHLY